METTLLCVGFSLNFIGLGALAWAVLRRRATIAPPTETHGVRLARAALAYARQTFPASRGDELLRHALNAFRELDLSEDGKRDYTDRQAGLYLRAVEAREVTTQQQVLEADARREVELEEADLKEIMSSPAGRRTFFAWLERCGVMASSFDNNAHTMAFLEGRRSMGIEMLQRIQAVTPTEYLQMMVEHAKTAAERALKLQAAKP